MALLLMMVLILGLLVGKFVQGWQATPVLWWALQFVLPAGLLQADRPGCVGLLRGCVAWWLWPRCFDLVMVEVTWFSSLCAWQQNPWECSDRFGSSDPRQGLSAHPQIDSMA